MRCEKCVAEEGAKKTTWRHRLKCEKWFETASHGEDYIKCALCEFRARQLTQHVKREHGITKEQYITQHGSIACAAASKVRSQTNKVNGNWYSRASEEKREEWRQVLGEKISTGIMESESAREARRQNMSRWNRSEEGRQLSSETAQKTSARPEIQERRAERLQKWRNENPEAFYEKCTRAMHNCWHSKPESRLGEILQEHFPDSFKHNQRFKNTKLIKSTKSSTRQIDFWDKSRNVVVEFDGPYHFEPIRGDAVLEDTRLRDAELNRVLPSLGFCLIRISHDQFDYKQGGHFRANCVQRVVKLVHKGESGLYLIGEAYDD